MDKLLEGMDVLLLVKVISGYVYQDLQRARLTPLTECQARAKGQPVIGCDRVLGDPGSGWRCNLRGPGPSLVRATNSDMRAHGSSPGPP